jgi:Tfp pilus assembly protein PilX
VVLAIALTACLLPTLCVGAYARLARLEDRRVALVEQTVALERANSQLKVQLEQLRAPDRLARLAVAAGMQPADPGKNVDFIVSRPGASGVASSPTSVAVAGKERLGAWLAKVQPDPSWTMTSRAEAASLHDPVRAAARPIK